jgi:perosamine synthetase
MSSTTARTRIPISRPFIGEEEKAAVMAVLDSGMLVQGPRVAELEARFAELCGVAHAVATSNGTTALHLALLAHGIGPGDEVITSPFTFVASANSILYVGARPVFVDIEPDTFNIDAAAVEVAVTPRTKALMPVHLYGQTADMTALMAIADRHGLTVIEDAAQAVGACHGGRPAGSFGTGCFSLYATKNVMTGEGGVVTTDSTELADRLRMLRGQGMRQRYQYESLGYNFRLSDLHAALGIVQMDRLPAFTEARRRNADFLTAGIRALVTPVVRPENEHVWHQYTVRVEGGLDRDQALARLDAAGIGTGVFYPAPVSSLPHVVAEAGPSDVPVAAQAARQVLSLPVHPLLSEGDLAAIVSAVNQLRA